MSARKEIQALLNGIDDDYRYCNENRSDPCRSEKSRSYYDGACWSYALVSSRLGDILKRLDAQAPAWSFEPPDPDDRHFDWYVKRQNLPTNPVTGQHKHRWRGVVDGSEYCTTCGIGRWPE